MKLSIVIVSWNVAKQLEQCLASIFAAPSPSLPLEVIVIDNASADTTVEMVRSRFAEVVLITNSENRGFGAACNQGIRAAHGEYVCFLNPDTETSANTLRTLVDYLDSHHDVGMVAPRILYPDGKTQASIRSFPTPRALVTIFFKLDRFLPFLFPLREYYARDFDYSRTQEVEQPMGACLMTRKKVLDEIGVFDEQFFIWFEEVDLCKRIKEAGHKIMYVANATIMHHQAKSFGKQDLLTRQRNFYTSAQLYLNKHFPSDWVGRAVAGIFRTYTRLVSFFLSLRSSIPQKREGSLFDLRIFAAAFLLIGAIEFFSLLVYSDFIPNLFAFVIVTALVGITAIWRLDIGGAILLSELIIGSKGYLFSIDSWDSRFPIRMAIFAVCMFAWGIFVCRDIFAARQKKQPLQLLSITRSRFLWWYVAMGGIIVYGFIAGNIFGYPFGTIVRDGNAWLFFLAAPALYDAFRNRGSIQFLTAVIAAGVSAQTIKVLLTFYIMGHQGFTNVILTPWYYWIRNTGVGEITSLPTMMTRVFFQSQIFALASFASIGAFALVYFMRQCEGRRDTVRAAISKGLKEYRWVMIFQSVLFASLIVSFSRSIWVAVVVAAMALLSWAVMQRISREAFFGFLAMMSASAVVGFLLLVAISGIPFPATSGVFDLRSVQERVSDVEDEAAAASRWQLLPVLVTTIRQNPISGYGFGKTVTYESKDPRITQGDTSARYTTFAFEWGYLDIWIKLGIIGIGVYVAFLLSIIMYGFLLSRQFQNQKRFWESALSLSISMGLIALAVTHVFTPYLNHPLGIGIIIIASIMVERLSEQKRIALSAD